MKKTLLATAIAGAAFASAGAQAATIYNEDGTKLDLYGNIQIAYYDVNDAAGDSKDTLTDNGSTVGFAGEHLITRDLKGYFKAEFEHDADEAKTAGGLNTGDQAYAGLKGNFGDTRVGSWDPLIDDWIQDPISNNESFDVKDSTQNIIGLSDREGNKVSYTSPSFSGFQFAVGTQFEGDAESFNPDVDTNVAGLTGQKDSSKGVQKDSDSNASFFGGVKYTAGAFSIAAVYDNLDNYDGTYSGFDKNDNPDTLDNDAGDQYGITAEYTVDTLRLALKLERFQAGDDLIEDVNYYGFGARYGYGMGDIYGSYQYVDVGGDSFLDTAKDGLGHNDFPNDGGESYNEITLGATYNISDAMYTFVEGGLYDRKDDVDDGVAVGAVYLF
ncbi:porin [Vreelandella subglaciescola]|uniref:Outer membrane protein (Porin) n=1 Tax=Vreelandella subglaciescola TaxID=29571 RepID=A0A1M7FLD6_9GAMM|nr:porin [Halomonas subglaciescola]SHM04795.1 Outer membrane protein (porin) [Halomonas subglaciescola]